VHCISVLTSGLLLLLCVCVCVCARVRARACACASPNAQKTVSAKQDDWLESCIQMISGLVNSESPAPADAYDLEDDVDYDKVKGD